MTAYHEQHSASALSGTMTLETVRASSESAMRARWRKMMAHWITKQISAMVATDRPTNTLESQVSKRQNLCTSARGSTERKAQPNTYAAQRRTMRSMRNGHRSREGAVLRKRRCSASNKVMLAALTLSRKTHQIATGFDQASQSKRMTTPRPSSRLH